MQNVLPSILDQLLLSESQTAPQPKRYVLSAKIFQQNFNDFDFTKIYIFN